MQDGQLADRAISLRGIYRRESGRRLSRCVKHRRHAAEPGRAIHESRSHSEIGACLEHCGLPEYGIALPDAFLQVDHDDP
jgi:hypothetical protein